ncbi:MAG: CsgG/HfaB family protein [Tepidisphaeraceae bacterium]
MTRKLLNCCIFTTVLLLTPLVHADATTQPATVPAAHHELTVALLNFQANLPGTGDAGPQVVDTLTATLSGEPGFTLVDRSTLDSILKEHELNLTGLVDADTAVHVGKLVGAQILVTGKIFLVDKSIFLTAKLIGTETGLVDGIIVKGQQGDDLGDLIIKLSQKVADHLRDNAGKLLPADEPTDPLIDLKKRLAKRPLPIVQLQVSEQDESAVLVTDPAVDTELRKVLTQCGFTVIDTAEINPSKAGVDLIVKGAGISEFAGRIGNLQICSARLELNAVTCRDGKTVFADRITSRAADLSSDIAGKTALQKAAHELGIRLIEHIADMPATAPSH